MLRNAIYDASNADVLYEFTKRQISPVLVKVLKSNKVVLTIGKKAMPRLFKVFIAKDAVYFAFNSFLKWWDDINNGNDVELVFSEKSLLCKYFGGTLDCLLKINGKYWLIDFKTSNHIEYSFIIIFNLLSSIECCRQHHKFFCTVLHKGIVK